MGPSEETRVLRRVLQIVGRSLPMYLAEARPFAADGHRPLQEALANMAKDQRTLADRAAEAIVALGDRPELGRFPMRFTSTHDLAIDFLVRRVIDRQQQDIATLQECSDLAADFPETHALAEEALGNSEGHLDILQEIIAGDG